MSEQHKRGAIHSDPELHTARSLLEDAADLEAFAEREDEPEMHYEAFVKSLKRRGKL